MARIPRQINPRWLIQAKNRLDLTAKTVRETGEPNPNHAKLAAEIEEAEAETVRWNRFETWIKKTYNLPLNQYSIRIGGETYEPKTVFMGTNHEGKKTYLTRERAWEKYEAAQKDKETVK